VCGGAVGVGVPDVDVSKALTLKDDPPPTGHSDFRTQVMLKRLRTRMCDASMLREKLGGAGSELSARLLNFCVLVMF